MSQTSDASQINSNPAESAKTRSKSKQGTSTVIVDAKPISTVPPTGSKQKSITSEIVNESVKEKTTTSVDAA
ncbi:hypothetical protein A2U01_0076913, partial [Trifolium medium]|nr:hypothetical protein [Trifolium medium]